MSEDAPEDSAAAQSHFKCPFPGCQRSYAELWKLRQHFRAPPRESARQGGHGQELGLCPRCDRELHPSQPHLGCLNGLAAPRQAVKRRRTRTKQEQERSMRRSASADLLALQPTLQQQLQPHRLQQQQTADGHSVAAAISAALTTALQVPQPSWQQQPPLRLTHSAPIESAASLQQPPVSCALSAAASAPPAFRTQASHERQAPLPVPVPPVVEGQDADQEAELAAACLQAVAANPTAVASIRAAVAANRAATASPGFNPAQGHLQPQLEQMVAAFVRAIIETQVVTPSAAPLEHRYSSGSMHNFTAPAPLPPLPRPPSAPTLQHSRSADAALIGAPPPHTPLAHSRLQQSYSAGAAYDLTPAGRNPSNGSPQQPAANGGMAAGGPVALQAPASAFASPSARAPPLPSPPTLQRSSASAAAPELVHGITPTAAADAKLALPSLSAADLAAIFAAVSGEHPAGSPVTALSPLLPGSRATAQSLESADTAFTSTLRDLATNDGPVPIGGPSPFGASVSAPPARFATASAGWPAAEAAVATAPRFATASDPLPAPVGSFAAAMAAADPHVALWPPQQGLVSRLEQQYYHHLHHHQQQHQRQQQSAPSPTLQQCHALVARQAAEQGRQMMAGHHRQLAAPPQGSHGSSQPRMYSQPLPLQPHHDQPQYGQHGQQQQQQQGPSGWAVPQGTPPPPLGNWPHGQPGGKAPLEATAGYGVDCQAPDVLPQLPGWMHNPEMAAGHSQTHPPPLMHPGAISASYPPASSPFDTNPF